MEGRRLGSKECVCIRGEDCSALSEAFHFLGDARGGFTRIPSYDSSNDKDASINNQYREALLKHVLPPGKAEREKFRTKEEAAGDDKSFVIANHHFHPKIVRKHSKGNECTIPMFISEGKAKQIGSRHFLESDKIRVLGGEEKYFVVPNYSFNKAKNSLAEVTRHACKSGHVLSQAMLKQKETKTEQEEASNTLGSSDNETDGKGDHKIVFLESSMARHEMDEPTSRDQDHDVLVAFESKRRTLHNTKVQSLMLKWKSTLATLEAGVEEVKRAERIMLGCAHANQAHAAAMEAIYEDVVSDGSETDSAATKDKALLEGSSTEEEMDTKGDKVDVELETDSHSSRLHIANDDILNALIGSQQSLSEEFAESALFMSMLAGQEMMLFRADVEEQVDNMKQLGKALTAQLEAIETQVEDSWDAYDSIAAATYHMKKSLSPVSSPRQSVTKKLTEPDTDSETSTCDQVEKSTELKSHTPHSPKSVMDLFPTNGELSPLPKVPPMSLPRLQQREDIWIMEMKYRVIVSYQSMVWNQAVPRLRNLIQSLVQIECKRQERLQALLHAFVPRQTRLFTEETTASLKQAHEQALTFLPPSNEEMCEDIEAAVQERVAQAAIDAVKERDNREGIHETDEVPALSSMDGESLLDEISITTDADLTGEWKQLPLLDSLLASITLERSQGWKRKATLAVVTCNRFLHLFDIPSSETLLSPEEAFEKIAPSEDRFFDNLNKQVSPPKLPSSSYVMKRRQRVVIQTSVEPVASFFLPRCTLVLDKDCARKLEIVEDSSGRFSREKHRKLLLPVFNQKSSDWSDCISKQQVSYFLDCLTKQQVSLEWKRNQDEAS